MNRREVLIGGNVSLLMLAAPKGAAARLRRSPWPGGQAGAVSLTYDDGLASHIDSVMPALEQRELRGTFYVTMNNIESRLRDWTAAPQRGHELANHTMHHYCGLQALEPEAFIASEVAPLDAWLRRVTPPSRVPTYAYPCDVTDLGGGTPNAQAKRYDHLLAREGIVAARTSEGLPNRPRTALHRPHRLQALAVGYDAPTADAVLEYLLSAVRHGHWAILVFHDVLTPVREKGQVSVDMHDRILDAIGKFPLWCAPLGQVFQAIRSRQE